MNNTPAQTTGPRVFYPRVQEATLIVEVPEDAVVFLSNQRMTLTGSVRHFRIPVTEAGREYAYPIRVELSREGRVLRTSRTEQVASGREIRVTLAEKDITEAATVAVR